MTLKQMAGALYNGLRKNSPKILFGLGLVGYIYAVHEAPKAARKAEEARDEYLKDGDKKKFIRGYIKAWGVVGGVFVASTACTGGAIGILHGRAVASGTALASNMAAFKLYRSRVVAKEGAEADMAYRYGLKEVSELTETDDKNGAKVVQHLVPDDEQGIDPRDYYIFAFDERNAWYTGDPQVDLIQMKKVYQNMCERYESSIDGKYSFRDALIDSGFEYALQDKKLAQMAGRCGWDRYSKKGDNYISFGPMFDAVLDDPRDYILGKTFPLIIEFNCEGDIYGD